MELLIVGSSVRAAAQSALRAGIRPFAVDRFADEDLTAVCPVRQASTYPRGLVTESRHFNAPAWMYTGALENFPTVIDSISRGRLLFGNNSHVVRRVRDPWKLAECLATRGLPFPNIQYENQPAIDGQWIRKPFRSGGGIGVQLLTDVHADDSRRPGRSTHYLQKFVPGEYWGAVFVGSSQRAVLLGATRQLVGCHWAGADGFAYVGSIGPLRLRTPHHRRLEAIGACLAEQFDLTGLFGIDVIRSGSEIWTVEVNPRYTASVEILERAVGFHALKLHVDACTLQTLPAPPSCNSNHLFAKATLYATRTHVVSPAFSDWVESQNGLGAWPLVADIPQPGSSIHAGHPICTVFADGDAIETVESRLRDEAARVRSFGA